MSSPSPPLLSLYYDPSDMCAPLTKELLRIQNRFNLPDFDQLRDFAVQSLLTNYPILAAPMLLWVNL